MYLVFTRMTGESYRTRLGSLLLCLFRALCVCVCVYVCCTHLFSFFPLAFVLVNDLSLVSGCFLFWKCVRFCFCFCCRLFLFVVSTCILCLLPCLTGCSFIDVLSCTPTGVSEINHLTWLDLTCHLSITWKQHATNHRTSTDCSLVVSVTRFTF